MQDLLSQAMRLKRPDLLVRAARFGLDDYSRDRDLRRCLKTEMLPSPGRALVELLQIEKQINSERVDRTGTYLARVHIAVLTAIMAETQAFRDTRPVLV